MPGENLEGTGRAQGENFESTWRGEITVRTTLIEHRESERTRGCAPPSEVIKHR